MTHNSSLENQPKISNLNPNELKMFNGGSSWHRLWRWLGKQVGYATIPNMETYDRDAELNALKQYGAPY